MLPDLEGLDSVQRARLERAAQEATQLYPESPDLQRAAVTAAADYLLGHTDPAAAGAELATVRRAEKRARARARQVAVMAFADGRSERAIARDVGVDRMNLRRWLGKPGRPPREAPPPGLPDRVVS
ncbi:hypothetical protein MAHJHV61_34190 [Mycobacterium avium subsp. hominissuis]